MENKHNQNEELDKEIMDLLLKISNKSKEIAIKLYLLNKYK